MPLALGTAQFGMDYGITNAPGKVGEADVARILEAAFSWGVRALDTAATYGDAEDVVGRVLRSHGIADQVAVTTKTIRIDGAEITPGDAIRMRDGVLRSRDRLRVETLDVVLVKFAGDLLQPGGQYLADALEDLRAAGVMRRIGLSSYLGDDVAAVAERLPLQVVQLPLSVLDQRPLSTGLVDALRGRGVTIQARSVLLQGIVASDPGRLPPFLRGLRPRLEAFQARARQAGVTPVQAAVAFVERLPGVEQAVLGVTSVAELRDVLASRDWDGDLPWADFACAAPEVACQEWPQ